MAIKPQIKNLNATSVEILNAIRNNASENFKSFIPKAENNIKSINQIGQILMQYDGLRNEFISALINRIGRVIITSKLYSNPWAMFKQGMLEYGETVEEIFVNIVKAQNYDVEKSENELFKREIPDVRSAFHVMNFQKFYKTTIQHNQLKQAFLSIEGVTDLISKIVESLYTSANYDEFLVMKYLLAKHILNGRLAPFSIPETSAENAREIVSGIKSVSNSLEFMGSDYNVSGVETHSAKTDQYIILNAHFDAVMDVNVLATSFNMGSAEFMGHRILINSFGFTKSEQERVNALLGTNEYFEPITDSQSKALDIIPCVIVDKSWFMVYDNMVTFEEAKNGQGLYWNYMYHTWKTFSVSPFANACVFVPEEIAVTSIEITPNAISATKGQTVYLTCNVTAKGFAPKTVNWSIDSENSTIENGKVVIGIDEDLTELTITATSTYDNTKTSSATITLI